MERHGKDNNKSAKYLLIICITLKNNKNFLKNNIVKLLYKKNFYNIPSFYIKNRWQPPSSAPYSIKIVLAMSYRIYFLLGQLEFSFIILRFTPHLLIFSDNISLTGIINPLGSLSYCNAFSYIASIILY